MKGLILKLITAAALFSNSAFAAQEQVSAQQLCQEFRDCNHLNSESTTKCLKDALVNAGLTKKRIDGGQARTMGPSLIASGFQDLGMPKSSKVPEGAILIVQPRKGCAGETGTILMKCSGEWVKSNERVAVAPSCPRKVFVHPGVGKK